MAEQRQDELPFRKLDKNGQLRGGRRDGAGRPRKGRGSAPHKRRAEVSARDPQHVVLRVADGVGSLRGNKAYRAIRRAFTVVLDRYGCFRIVHFSLQRDHVHLLCEANDKQTLAQGLKAFEISAAKHLNRELTPRGQRRRRGRVFADRYHVESISTVRGARNALNYVLNNWRKHREDRDPIGLFAGRIDPFSSGVWFVGWKERTLPYVAAPPGYEPPDVANPHTWLLSVGYQRGAPISCFDVPGNRKTR